MTARKRTKKWKDALLTSSLPLEYSVTELLKKFGVSDAAEFKYERPNETGQMVTFSIDIHGSKALNKNRISVEMFVECKYRHPSTQWVFLPHSFASPKDVCFEDTFISLDDLCQQYGLNWGAYNPASMTNVICGKGIELYENGEINTKTIRQAISQLQYSLVAKARDCMWQQIDDIFGDPGQIFVLVPWIVTTAELWRLKPGTTVERIREESELKDVAEQVEFLLVRELPDNDLKRYSEEFLRKNFLEPDVKRIDQLLKEQQSRRAFSFSHLVRTYAETYPCTFWVGHYGAIETRLRNMFSFFEKPALVRPKGPKGA